jgi:hypothetical protein
MAVHDIERIEQKIDRAAAGAMVVSDQIGGVMFQSMAEVMEFSKIMATTGSAVPKHLRGDVGACLAVITQALEWRMSPFAVANKSYFVNDRIAFESQLIHAVIESRAPLQGRLKVAYEGSGPDRKCIVTGHLKDEVEPVVYTSPAIKDIAVKNSPLWKADPDQQLWYYASRAWARRFCPDVLLGIYSKDELEADHTGPEKAKDITPKPKIGERLKGTRGRGFDAGHVERQTNATVITETAVEPSVPATAEAGESSTSSTHDAGTSPQGSDSPATDSMTVPDAFALGQQMRAEGKPLEIPDEISGDLFSAQQEALKSGYGEQA